MSILLILFFGFIISVVLDVPFLLVILLTVVIGIVVHAVDSKLQKLTTDSIVKAKLIEEKNVYKKKSELTGYSVSWDSNTKYHYKYKDVLDYCECTFDVTYQNGKHGTLKCKKGSELYKALITKSKKTLN